MDGEPWKCSALLPLLISGMTMNLTNYLCKQEILNWKNIKRKKKEIKKKTGKSDKIVVNRLVWK